MKRTLPRLVALLLSTAILLLPAGSGAETRRILYDGAAELFSQEDAVVVYPGASAARAGTNRLSAEARAANLLAVHGVAAEVVADVDVTEEQLGRTLLVLGWDNRLLTDGRVSRPFKKDATGWGFLDSVRGAPDEDLLFSAQSPFDSERILVFWSRIDPEIDRFMSFPFLGSDWGIYRDFSVIRQGRFKDRTSWPPVRNPEAEKDHRETRSPYDSVSRSAHYTLHLKPGSPAADQANRILERREAALKDASERLGASIEGVRIDLHVYSDAEEKTAMTGVADPAHNVARARELHMVVDYADSLNPHEELQILARQEFGPCYLTAFCKGLPLSLEQRGARDELPVFAALMLEREAIPAIEDLLDEEKLRALGHAGFGYPAVALLVRWLDETGGHDRIRKAFGLKSAGRTEIGALAGLEPAAVDPTFRKWIEGIAAGARGELSYRKALAEARQHGQVGDHEAEASAIARALEAKPDDPSALYQLGLARKRADLPDEAKGAFRRLVELEMDEASLRYVIYGHYQLGRIHAAAGDTDRARARYRKVLELPDRYESHRRTREAIDELEDAGGGN